jgi:ribosome-interacting GTPase 1
VPANLPPDYFAAESAFRAATTPQAKLEAVERMLSVTPHHKGTDHLRAELRARKASLLQEAGRQRSHGHVDLYSVHREGAGQAVLVGAPNAGKSSLLQALTGASARVADYPFTTQLPQPAMMRFEDIQVQLVDLPALASGATPAWLRGVIPQADLVLLLVDLDTDPTSELRMVRSELAALQDPLRLAPTELLVGTKLDLPAGQVGAELLRMELDEHVPLLVTSSVSHAGLEELRVRVVSALDVVRVYAKPPGRPADLSRPFVLRRGATVEDLADMVHHEVRNTLHFAVRWPPDGLPLRVAHRYQLADRDVIELHAG